MKYWCYYTDVVRYLERIEAGQSQKREGPAYLVWQDGDGPSMIIGPGVEWYRGDGPPPDIDAISLRVGRPPATLRRTPPNRSPKAARRGAGILACRVAILGDMSWAPRLTITPIPPTQLRSAPPKRRIKGVRIFRNPLKPVHPSPRNNRDEMRRLVIGGVS